MPTSGNGTTVKTGNRSLGDDEIVPIDEAAELLDIPTATLNRYVERKVLQQREGAKLGTVYVSLQDVCSISGLLSSGMNLASTAHRAIEALATATSNSRRIARLETLLGVDVEYLKVDEESVLSFYRECLDLTTDYTETMPPNDILRWSSRFAAVTEEYLEALGVYTGLEEPWDPVMFAAQKLYESAPRETFRYRKDLEVAYGYLAAARLHIRQVAYFYIRKKHGAAVANKACPETSTVERDDKIIRLIFMMET